MAKKKNAKKSVDTAETTVSPSENRSSGEDWRRRFGAVAFVENPDIDENGPEPEAPLSLDSLREAFAALDVEERQLAEHLPSGLVEDDRETSADDSDDDKPAYDDISWSVFAGDISDEDAADAPDAEPSTDFGETVEISPKTIVEAMLFVGDRENRPVSPAFAAERMRNVTPREIDDAVAELNRDYQRLGCPYTILEEPDGYRMVLRPEFEPILAKFYGKIRDARLSQQAIDTLAVVAYRQPITAEEVREIRKQPSSSLLAQLVRRGLLGVEHEMREKKKIMLYRTTDRFLELFQLESIDDLPVSEELDFR